jgi:hypothetical protein
MKFFVYNMLSYSDREFMDIGPDVVMAWVERYVGLASDQD